MLFFLRQSKFATFPDVLVVHARKFQLVDWVPQKLGELRIASLTIGPLTSSLATSAVVIMAGGGRNSQVDVTAAVGSEARVKA